MKVTNDKNNTTITTTTITTRTITITITTTTITTTTTKTTKKLTTTTTVQKKPQKPEAKKIDKSKKCRICELAQKRATTRFVASGYFSKVYRTRNISMNEIEWNKLFMIIVLSFVFAWYTQVHVPMVIHRQR